MANELKIAYDAAPLYSRVFNATGQVWNTSGTPAFEAWADGNVADYVIALTDQNSGEHLGDFPTGIAAGTYQVIAYEGSGALADVAVSPISSIIWDGTAEVPLASQDDVTDSHATTDALVSSLSSSLLSVLNIYDESKQTRPGGTYPIIEDGTDSSGVYP